MRVFISGCGRGIGRALAEQMRREHEVHGCDLAPCTIEGVETHVCDIRNPVETRRVSERVGPVDLLVNNAGHAVFNTIEEADLASISDLFDVNVIGTARVTQAFLPGLREQSGTIVQLSSIAGRTVFPESGFYAATKYALEAMTEALFQETCTFGIKIRLVQPGSFETGFQETARLHSRERDPTSPYADHVDRWDRRRTEVLDAPQSPALVAAAIVQSLTDPTPFLRIPVGKDSTRILGLRDRLGADGWSRFAADRMGLMAPHRPGELPHPEEFLKNPEDPRLRALLQEALDANHLGHWKELEVGRRALVLLNSGRPSQSPGRDGSP